MKHRSIFLSAASAFLISGCTAKTPTVEQSSMTAIVVEKTELSSKPKPVTTPAPNGKAVLTDIYQQPVEAEIGSQLSDGRYASYWNGHQFTLNDKEYFVGFTEATPPSEIEYPAPGDMVTISQATYEFVDTQWELKAVQHDVGKFGGKNKAPTVNSDQKTMTLPVAGKLIIATPTAIFAYQGIQLFFYELFSFSAESAQWKYLGSIDAGSENSGGCAHEADSSIKIKCVKSTGILTFTPVENSIWPELKVLLQGTELGEDGNVISLTGKKPITYRYDDMSSNYLPINKI